MIKIVNWNNKEWDIKCDNCNSIHSLELVLQDIVYKKKYICRDNPYILLDNPPLYCNKDKYYLSYNIKLRDNEDNPDFKFIIYLVNKTVDYINNLELVYQSDEDDEQPNDNNKEDDD